LPLCDAPFKKILWRLNGYRSLPETLVERFKESVSFGNYVIAYFIVITVPTGSSGKRPEFVVPFPVRTLKIKIP
jgi:hypothetical protein